MTAPAKAGFNPQRLFLTSCISLVTTSMVFSIRGDIKNAMTGAFHITNEQMGDIWGPAFWAFTISIFICGALVDWLGMKKLHALSSIGYLIGVGLILAAPRPTDTVPHIFENQGTLMLYAGFFMMGLSQGIVEGVINPLVASLYSDNKTHKLNTLHAWWPGGLVIGGLLAYLFSELHLSWELKLSLILIPAVVYLVMSLTQEYPPTERAASNVSTGEMWGQVAKPLFLLLFVCMWMTAATELAPDQWFPSLMGTLTGIDQNGILFLVYTAGLMFVLRFFAGAISHKISPIGLLLGCAVISGIGLFWLGSLDKSSGPVMAFAAATVFGVGKTYFWPTMLAVTSEQFPRGGALLMNLMGGTGMLSVAVALPYLGKQIDNLGAAGAIKTVAILPVILTVIFALLFAYFKAKGGYQAQHLATEPASDLPVDGGFLDAPATEAP